MIHAEIHQLTWLEIQSSRESSSQGTTFRLPVQILSSLLYDLPRRSVIIPCKVMMPKFTLTRLLRRTSGNQFYLDVLTSLFNICQASRYIRILVIAGPYTNRTGYLQHVMWYTQAWRGKCSTRGSLIDQSEITFTQCFGCREWWAWVGLARGQW